MTFTAIPTNGGTPTYQWYNGVIPISGETGSTYTSSTLINGAQISVVMNSTATCATGNPATSNIITMTVNPILPVSIVYCSALIVIALIDLYHHLILNKIVYPFAIIAAVINFFIPGLFSLHNFLFGLLGGAVGFLILFLPALIYSKGMGWGDVKMAGLMGLMVGFPNVIVAVFGGIILGGLMAVMLLIFKQKSRKQGIPFGPYLSIGAVIAILWGSNIIHWYLHLAKME